MLSTMYLEKNTFKKYIKRVSLDLYFIKDFKIYFHEGYWSAAFFCGTVFFFPLILVLG